MKSEIVRKGPHIPPRAVSRKSRNLAILLLALVFSIMALDHGRSEEKKMYAEKTLLIIGASYAKGWNLEYPSEITISNMGVGGNQTQEMLDRFEDDVLSKKPDTVIVWGFINDIFRGDRAEISVVRKKAVDNTDKMLNLLLENNILPILASEIPVRRPAGIKESIYAVIGKVLGKNSYQDYINSNVKMINQELSDIARERNILYLDFYSVFANDKGERKRAYSLPDGSHVSDEGYRALSSYTKKNYQVD